MLHRGSAIFLLILLGPLPLRAEPICGIASALQAIDISSQEILFTAEPAIAAQRIDELDFALRNLSEFTFMTVLPGSKDALIRSSVKDFIGTRRVLVEIFRAQGFNAARAYMMNPFYQVQGLAIHRIRRRSDCNADTLPGAPEDGPDAAPQPPDRQATELRLANAFRSRKLITRGMNRDMNIVILILLNVLTGIFVVVAQMSNRSYTRYACNVPTRLRIGDVTMTARITNISRTGAQLRTESLFAPGDRGDILLDGAPFRVKVIWVNPHFMGVKFQPKLGFSPKRLTVAAGYA